jgi:hypothetical protein
MRKYFALAALAVAAVLMVAAVGGKGSIQAAGGSISGVITDSVTGQPITGARVMAGNCRQSATTASDGSYTIRGLAAGDYTITAMKPMAYAMKQYPSTVHVDEGQQVTGINLALAPMGGGGGNGSISGAVFNKKTGKPIAGARVMAGGCRNSATTASDGTYTLANLADGSYTVQAMKGGYLCGSYPSPVVIQNGQSVTGIDIYLEPGHPARKAD